MGVTFCVPLPSGTSQLSLSVIEVSFKIVKIISNLIKVHCIVTVILRIFFTFPFLFCFIKRNGDLIAAGSDDGNLFIWDRKTTNLVRVIEADKSIVNCVQSHPSVCMLATSGIETVVKLWGPVGKVSWLNSFAFWKDII